MKSISLFSACRNQVSISEIKISAISILVLVFMTFSSDFSPLFSQVPQGFNYQAVLGDASGNPVRNTDIKVKISVLSDTIIPVIIWEELHPAVKTGGNGAFSLTLGAGQRETTSSVALFSDISWNIPQLFLRTQVYHEGAWKVMGAARLWSVPYSMMAGEISGSLEKLSVNGVSSSPEEAIFEVKNTEGQTVFAVFNEGVRVYVDDGSKGSKGGFSIGGFADSKEAGQDYFVVNRDSIRAYIVDDPLVKGAKGGFSIGGFADSKGITNEYLLISPDSARIYVDNVPSVKGKKGGFAIGGFGSSKRTDPQNLLTVSDDSIRIYIDDETKGAKGGFSIGGFADSKAVRKSFFNISTDASGRITPAQNRILWYPIKNAFLTGQVLIEHPDSIGVNSTTTGYESRAKGAYSQAMGYRSVARGLYSTAIGKEAYAGSDNSFALGAGSKVFKSDSYAFGAGAIAAGTGSFSFGSAGRDTAAAVSNGVFTAAMGDFSLAIGQGTRSVGTGSVGIGMNNSSGGEFSSAMGFENSSSGRFSSTFGADNTASGGYSIAMGNNSKASGKWAAALGHGVEASGLDAVAIGSVAYSINDGTGEVYSSPTIASGIGSVALGNGVSAQAFASHVVGRQNVESDSYSTNSWVETDPVFVIGNGKGVTAGIPNRSNAMVVLKNGNVGLGTNSPDYRLDVSGTVRLVTSGLNIYSGNNTLSTGLVVGRSLPELGIGVASLNGEFCQFTSAGDGVIRTLQNTKKLFIANGGAEPTMVVTYGKVGIGTDNPLTEFHVIGNVSVEGNIIYTGSLNHFPDYVFLPEYTNYFSTYMVEQYISENGHLPWYTPAKDQQNGVNLTKMQFQTVETVENLQLQLIELNRDYRQQIEKQQSEIDMLRAELELLRSYIEK